MILSIALKLLGIIGWFFTVVFFIVLIVLSILLPIDLRNKKYRNFVNEHSVALKNLRAINNKYAFKIVPNYNMYHVYDNENLYYEISPRDYLTYQLVSKQDLIEDAIEDAHYNSMLWAKYSLETKRQCKLDEYDTTPLPNTSLLRKLTRERIEEETKTAIVIFYLTVRIEYRNMAGSLMARKSYTFNEKDIKEIILNLRNKYGSFYRDRYTWDAICRVERGKVSNKLRFAIYERDHNRCVYCGSTHDLEIDHIIPISKGGKSEWNNLQTLCHRCNIEKGDKM